MERVRRLLGRPAIFHCKPRGGGLTRRDFELVHSVDSSLASTDLPDWMPPSLCSVLSEFGALALFQPDEYTPDGFRLFTPSECDNCLEVFLTTMEDAAEFLDDDELNHSLDAEKWSRNLRPIGEVVASGDLFAIDMTSRRADGECPVAFLDHEYYFGGWLDPDDTEVVAHDAIELVVKILEDPLPYLASTWTGGDPYDQWFPESVSFDEDKRPII